MPACVTSVLDSDTELLVRTAVLRRPVGQADTTRLRVWQLYWVNGRYTIDDSARQSLWRVVSPAGPR